MKRIIPYIIERGIELNLNEEEITKLIYYITEKGNGTIENYYTLYTELTGKHLKLEKEKNNPVQLARETILEELIHYIIVVGLKLKLKEEEICEVYRERIEAFQKAISQDYKG